MEEKRKSRNVKGGGGGGGGAWRQTTLRDARLITLLHLPPHTTSKTNRMLADTPTQAEVLR